MKTLSFDSLVRRLQEDWPNIRFERASESRWSPEEQAVFYSDKAPNKAWSLLHEVGHMLCGHTAYNSDIRLLTMEVDAWERAKEYSARYGHDINQDYIEKCLDSYREWLHKRSMCPDCAQNGIELHEGNYKCINCKNTWTVSSDRFCRIYRKKIKPPIFMEGFNQNSVY